MKLNAFELYLRGVSSSVSCLSNWVDVCMEMRKTVGEQNSDHVQSGCLQDMQADIPLQQLCM